MEIHTVAAGVFTKNIDEANFFSRGIKAGTVWINCYGKVELRFIREILCTAVCHQSTQLYYLCLNWKMFTNTSYADQFDSALPFGGYRMSGIGRDKVWRLETHESVTYMYTCALTCSMCINDFAECCVRGTGRARSRAVHPDEMCCDATSQPRLAVIEPRAQDIILIPEMCSVLCTFRGVQTFSARNRVI
jgi:hypothetical protein